MSSQGVPVWRAIAVHFHAAEEASAEEILRSIETMTMIESHYSPEQTEFLIGHGKAVGEERMKQAPADWAALLAESGPSRRTGPTRSIRASWS